MLNRDIDVPFGAYSLDNLVQVLEPARRLRLVMLDSCRDNPFCAHDEAHGRSAAQNMPGYRIQHTRHKSDQMVARYVREADKWTKNGLKGAGF